MILQIIFADDFSKHVFFFFPFFANEQEKKNLKNKQKIM